MSAQHTPGPWFVHDTIDGPLWASDVRDRRNLFVARCAPMFGRPQADEFEANARLIAAAPDLLEALTCFINEADAGHVTVDTDRKARAAIAKARGEA